MNPIFSTPAAKLLVYILASFLLAAALCPWVYDLGQWFSGIHSNSTGLPGYLAEKAKDAPYSRYFKRCIILAALVLVPPYLWWKKRSASDQFTPPKLSWQPSLARHLYWGALISFFSVFLLGASLQGAGWYEIKDSIDWGKAFKKACVAAFFVALVEELFFRGLLFNLFIVSFSRTKALIFLCLIFTFLHFLHPPKSLMVENPSHWFAGFEMLGLSITRLLSIHDFIYEFMSILIIGLILTYARVWTHSLYLSLGLHAGWVFAFKLFKEIYQQTGQQPESLSLLLGRNLKEGFLPIAMLLITFWIVRTLWRKSDASA